MGDRVFNLGRMGQLFDLECVLVESVDDQAPAASALKIGRLAI
jgi:hypothetical protein